MLYGLLPFDFQSSPLYTAACHQATGHLECLEGQGHLISSLTGSLFHQEALGM